MFEKCNKARCGYIILSIGVVLGLLGTYNVSQKLEEESKQRNIEIENFVIQQCEYTDYTDQVILNILGESLLDVNKKIILFKKNGENADELALSKQRLERYIRTLNDKQECVINNGG